MADSAVFPGADRVLDPGVDPVRGVDVGGLPEPAFGAGGPVRGLHATHIHFYGTFSRRRTGRARGGAGRRRPAVHAAEPDGDGRSLAAGGAVA